MKLNDYQDTSLEAAGLDISSIKPNRDMSNLDFMSKILGLSGETGEVSEKFKKIIRDKKGRLDEDDVAGIVKNLETSCGMFLPYQSF